MKGLKVLKGKKGLALSQPFFLSNLSCPMAPKIAERSASVTVSGSPETYTMSLPAMSPGPARVRCRGAACVGGEEEWGKQ